MHSRIDKALPVLALAGAGYVLYRLWPRAARTAPCPYARLPITNMYRTSDNQFPNLYGIGTLATAALLVPGEGTLHLEGVVSQGEQVATVDLWRAAPGGQQDRVSALQGDIRACLGLAMLCGNKPGFVIKQAMSPDSLSALSMRGLSASFVEFDYQAAVEQIALYKLSCTVWRPGYGSVLFIDGVLLGWSRKHYLEEWRVDIAPLDRYLKHLYFMER